MCPDALNMQTCCYLQKDNLKQHTFCSHFMGFMVVINALFLLIISIDYYQCLLVMCVVSSIVTSHVGIYCMLAASAPLATLSSSAFLPPPHPVLSFPSSFPTIFRSTLFILEFTHEQNMKCMSSCIWLTMLNTVCMICFCSFLWLTKTPLCIEIMFPSPLHPPASS